jgi:hypothetical protein
MVQIQLRMSEAAKYKDIGRKYPGAVILLQGNFRSIEAILPTFDLTDFETIPVGKAKYSYVCASLPPCTEQNRSQTSASFSRVWTPGEADPICHLCQPHQPAPSSGFLHRNRRRCARVLQGLVTQDTWRNCRFGLAKEPTGAARFILWADGRQGQDRMCSSIARRRSVDAAAVYIYRLRRKNCDCCGWMLAVLSRGGGDPRHPSLGKR